MPIDEPLTPPYALIWPSEDSGENDPRSSLTGPSISFYTSGRMAGGRVIGTTPLGLQKTNPSPLGNDPKFYSVSKTNSRAFGAGQLDLAIIEHITSGRLAFDQFVRFDNLNPPCAN